MVSKLVYVAAFCLRFFRKDRLESVLLNVQIIQLLLQLVESVLAHVEPVQRVQLLLQAFQIKVRVHGQLVVHQRVCPSLLACQLIQPDDRHRFHPEIRRGDQAPVSFDDLVFPDADRIQIPEFLHRQLDLLDLPVRVLLRVPVVRLQALDRDVLDS